MIEIQLSRDAVAIVDDEDFDKLNQFKWSFDGRYASRHQRNSSKTIRMHNDIMNTPKGMEVDHINGNPLDNRKSNLRICSHSQNMMNCKIRSDNTSGSKGVWWDKVREKWFVRLETQKGRLNLGRFSDKQEAINTYNEAAKKHFGEFARNDRGETL
jgi:hypothetical protein